MVFLTILPISATLLSHKRHEGDKEKESESTGGMDQELSSKDFKGRNSLGL